jgi:hypothetical protein
VEGGIGAAVHSMKAYLTVTFIILFLTSALDVVRVQLRTSAVCPRPSSRGNGALQMRSHVGFRAGQEASKGEKPVAPALNQTTIPRLSSMTYVI